MRSVACRTSMVCVLRRVFHVTLISTWRCPEVTFLFSEIDAPKRLTGASYDFVRLSFGGGQALCATKVEMSLRVCVELGAARMQAVLSCQRSSQAVLSFAT